VGKLVVDLSELDFDGRTESADRDLSIGKLTVIVPDSTCGQGSATANAAVVMDRCSFVVGSSGLGSRGRVGALRLLRSLRRSGPAWPGPRPGFAPHQG
jgi:hypothetical protein